MKHQNMTVGELRELLEGFTDDTPVWLGTPTCCGCSTGLGSVIPRTEAVELSSDPQR